MQGYELTIVLGGPSTAAKKKSFIQKLEKLVKVFGGKLGKSSDWGEKELAYKIKKFSSGSFIHFPLELEREKAKGFADKIRLEPEIIRYLLVRNG